MAGSETRGELLANRSGLEDGIGADRHLMLDVGETVPLGGDDAALLDDRHGDAGDLLSRHLGADERVDLVQSRLVIGAERHDAQGGGGKKSAESQPRVSISHAHS